MILFAELFGIFIASVGLAVALRPEIAGMALAFWEKDRRFYLGGILRVAFAGILFMASEETLYPVAVLVLAVLFLISGILCFVLPETKILKILEWAHKRSAAAVRVWGVVVALLGILIAYLTY